MGKSATALISNYYDQINLIPKNGFIIVSKTLLNNYKKENNLQHVKNKIYFKGLILKTI